MASAFADLPQPRRYGLSMQQLAFLWNVCYFLKSEVWREKLMLIQQKWSWRYIIQFLRMRIVEHGHLHLPQDVQCAANQMQAPCHENLNSASFSTYLFGKLYCSFNSRLAWNYSLRVTLLPQGGVNSAEVWKWCLRNLEGVVCDKNKHVSCVYLLAAIYITCLFWWSCHFFPDT